MDEEKKILSCSNSALTCNALFYFLVKKLDIVFCFFGSGGRGIIRFCEAEPELVDWPLRLVLDATFGAKGCSIWFWRLWFVSSLCKRFNFVTQFLVKINDIPYFLVMSPSRAGSSHSSSWRIFSSARLVTFLLSARIQKMAKTSRNFDFRFFNHHYYK